MSKASGCTKFANAPPQGLTRWRQANAPQWPQFGVGGGGRGTAGID